MVVRLGACFVAVIKRIAALRLRGVASGVAACAVLVFSDGTAHAAAYCAKDELLNPF